jgi:DHA3 family macrolide efflux protein-like MFS transporter
MQEWKKKFFIIWTGQAISILTSQVLQMAIVWYVTLKTGSAALLSLATLIGFLPQALLGIFIGVYIDRFKRKSVMIIADLGIALAGLSLVFYGFWAEIPLWLIYVVLFIRSIGNAFHVPALQAAIPLIVPKEELTRYAGYAHGFKSFSFLISPALAAILYNIWSLNYIVLLDVAGALLAVAFLWVVKIPNDQPMTVKAGADSAQSEWQRTKLEAKDGFAALKRQEGLPQLLVISMLYAFIYFPIGTLFPLITMTWFGGGVKESGMVEVMFSLGMLAGSFLLGLWGKKIRHERAILASMGLYGVFVLTSGLLPPSGLYVFAAMSFLIGVINPFYHGVLTSLYQLRVEEEYLGRVLSLVNSVSLIAMPVGLILAGSFAEVLGVNHYFKISGIATLVLFFVALFILPPHLGDSKTEEA